jgi:hypothetical protein
MPGDLEHMLDSCPGWTRGSARPSIDQIERLVMGGSCVCRPERGRKLVTFSFILEGFGCLQRRRLLVSSSPMDEPAHHQAKR